MRKIVFIGLSVAVLAIIGIFGWREFHVPEINYVSDEIVAPTNNYLRVHRLYSAQIDREAYEKSLNDLTYYTRYTEEEKIQAAIEAGRPAFFPSFNISGEIMPSQNSDEIWINGHIAVGLVEGQTERRFRMGKTSVEAIAQGDLALRRVEIYSRPDKDEHTVVRISNDSQAAFEITDAASFRVAMSGEGGMLSLQFVYNVDVQTPLVLTVKEERTLHVHVLISRNEIGRIVCDFIVEPYCCMEECVRVNGETSGNSEDDEPPAPFPWETVELGGLDWIVLENDEESDRMLVLSRRVLSNMGFMSGQRWLSSSMRNYLNGEFYETTFTDAERAWILETTLANYDNQNFGTAGGDETTDRVFLLSINEVLQYMGDREQLHSGDIIDDDYNERRMAQWREEDRNVSWALRSPGAGFSNYGNAYVNFDGSLNLRGERAPWRLSGIGFEELRSGYWRFEGIRPAMWISTQA
ncbi:MAG: DUF6273 domain-containing protein [Oscillospiraceae bacterium]|nr:DUF6273 domain-containing protein [Oscillospiraceae bacterium]